MKHFKFEEYVNFPWDQSIMKTMQSNSIEPFLTALKELKSDRPFLIGGCEIEDLGWGNIKINPGLIYSPEYGICTFEGYPSLPDDEMGWVIKFETTEELLMFEDMELPAIVNNRAWLENSGSADENEWRHIILNRSWYDIIGGRVASKAWTPIILPGASAGEYLDYKHNTVSGMVSIRGAKKHFNITTADNPMMMTFADIPTHIQPDYTVRFRTNLNTHLATPIREYGGSLYTGEVGMFFSSGIAISQRRLAVGTSADFLHYFNFSYQL